MKILIYTHEYPPFLGGLATTSSKLAFGISDSGHEVTVLAPRYSADDKSYDAKADFVTIRMNGLTRNHGIPSPIKEAAGFLSLRSIIAKQNPDLLLLITREAHAAAGLLCNLPSKIITRVAGYEAVGYLSSKKLFNKLIAVPMKKLYLKSSKIISPSESTKDLLIKAGIPESKIAIIYNGVNKNLVSQRQNPEAIKILKDKLRIKDSDKVMLTVSRVVKGKGQEAVIKILPNILKKQPDTKYLIVGHGSHQDYLKQLALRLRTAQNVIFAGPIPNTEVINYYDLCDIFILPNIAIKKKENIEGLPNVIFEASARAKPVITGIPGGGKEIIEDGISGFVVNGENLEEIEQRVLELLGDEKKAVSFGINGKTKIESNFTEQIMIDNYLNLINNLQ
jgi:glycosyltransferase involved in cell wall biosynthesis